MNQAGRIILDLAPHSGNPRNSEGAFIELRDGRLLFVFSRFNGAGAGDNAPAYLASIESTDGGETWSAEKVLITAEQDQAENIMSVSLLRMQNGDLGLFYFIRRGYDYGKEHLRRSPDEGQTWGEAIPCVPARGYYVTNNDRVIRHRSGRLIVPASYSRTVNTGNGSAVTWDSRMTTLFCYSDDDGRTWRESNLCALNARCTRSGLQEPGLIELLNGSLYGWARTDLGVQYEMLSCDRGATWTEPQPSRFTSPCSPLAMKRDPGTGNLIAVWNPVPEYLTRPQTSRVWTGGRTPLVCSISTNDGQTWSEPFALEDDPASGFCYIAMHFIGENMLLAYCAGGNDDGMCLNRLRIRKLPIPREIS